jgi:hypothetical protein
MNQQKVLIAEAKMITNYYILSICKKLQVTDCRMTHCLDFRLTHGNIQELTLRPNASMGKEAKYYIV